jgi:hypothetical protein
MTNKIKRNLKKYFTASSETLTLGTANRWGIHNVINLSTLLDGLSLDGERTIAKRIRLRLFTYCGQLIPIRQLAVCIQTAGTVTDTVDIVGNQNLSDILNEAIDDVFGYYSLTELKDGKVFPNGTSANPMSIISYVVDIPNHLVGLLNKETETERLQELYFALATFNESTTSAITRIMVEVDYATVSKSIVIR